MTDTPEESDASLDPTAPLPEDCPCIRCGYNLRGLPLDINCPECGCPVARTMEMVNDRVLCPSCLAPAHPSAATCPKCGAPLTAAGANASYYSTRTAAASPFESGPPSPVGLVLIWVVLAPFLFIVGLNAYNAWVDERAVLESLRAATCYLIGFALLSLPLFFATRSFLRARKKARQSPPTDQAAP